MMIKESDSLDQGCFRCFHLFDCNACHLIAVICLVASKLINFISRNVLGAIEDDKTSSLTP